MTWTLTPHVPSVHAWPTQKQPLSVALERTTCQLTKHPPCEAGTRTWKWCKAQLENLSDCFCTALSKSKFEPLGLQGLFIVLVCAVLVHCFNIRSCMTSSCIPRQHDGWKLHSAHKICDVTVRHIPDPWHVHWICKSLNVFICLTLFKSHLLAIFRLWFDYTTNLKQLWKDENVYHLAPGQPGI